MFKARDPINYLEPLGKRKMPGYTGISAFLERCKDGKLEGYEYGPGFESRPVKRRRVMAEQKEKHSKELMERQKEFDPSNNDKIDGDAYKTLIVARLPYEITEPALRREFETFGSVRKVRLIFDNEVFFFFFFFFFFFSSSSSSSFFLLLPPSSLYFFFFLRIFFYC